MIRTLAVRRGAATEGSGTPACRGFRRFRKPWCSYKQPNQMTAMGGKRILQAPGFRHVCCRTLQTTLTIRSPNNNDSLVTRQALYKSICVFSSAVDSELISLKPCQQFTLGSPHLELAIKPVCTDRIVPASVTQNGWTLFREKNCGHKVDGFKVEGDEGSNAYRDPDSPSTPVMSLGPHQPSVRIVINVCNGSILLKKSASLP